MNAPLKPPTITATMLQRQIGTMIRRVAQDGETIIVERDSWPVMALLPISEYKALLRDRQRIDEALGAKRDDKR